MRSDLPTHAKCNIGWEAAFRNKNAPLRFAQRHHDIVESDFVHFFLPTVPNASATLKAWPAYKKMQSLSPENKVLKQPWVSNFSRAEYLSYVSTDKNESELVFPEQYHCGKYVKASVLLLERYAVVGTLESLSDMYNVLYARAQIKNHIDVSHISNPSSKVMSSDVEKQVISSLKETMFCQTLIWRMAGEISSYDMKCPQVESGHNK